MVLFVITTKQRTKGKNINFTVQPILNQRKLSVVWVHNQ